VTTKTAAERVAALRDEYDRLGENVDHLSDLDLLNQYAEIRERECIDTRDRYMRLLTEQRKHGDRVREAATQEIRGRIDIVATQAVERQVREAARIADVVDRLPSQPKPEQITRLREVASSVKHMLRLLEEDRTEWKLDNHYDLVNNARHVVGVLRDRDGISASEVLRLVGEALKPNGNLRDLFKVADAGTLKPHARLRRPVFMDADWSDTGGYYAYEPEGSRFRVVAYTLGDTWWMDLQGPTGALIAAGEVEKESEVAETAAALIEQAPELAASGLRPWQCWQRAITPTTTSAATAA
jgi:hypothetical protein